MADGVSILERIKRLDEERAGLIKQVQGELMKQVEASLGQLRQYGFNYKLVRDDGDGHSAVAEGDLKTTPTPTKAEATLTARAPRGERAQQILDLLSAEPTGLKRAEILDRLNAKGDKKREAAVSNQLVILSKAGKVGKSDGRYVLGGASGQAVQAAGDLADEQPESGSLELGNESAAA